MAHCTDNDVSARLAAALAPEEFPEDSAAIEEHIRTCAPCRDELHALRLIDGFLREHKESLSGAVSGCPSVEALVDYAEGKEIDDEIRGHVALCSECAAYVRLIRDLAVEGFPVHAEPPTLGQRRFIRDTVQRQYGDDPESLVSRIASFIQVLRASLSVPSLAIGAAVAALLLIMVLPRGPEQHQLFPLMSDVTWQSSVASSTKSPVQQAPCADLRKKVALIIVSSGKDVLSDKQAYTVYEHTDIAKKLGSSYDFLSPKDLHQAMGKLEETHDLNVLAERVRGQTKADYVLFFQIAKHESRYSVKGMLFDGKGSNEKFHLFHSGLMLDRVPSLITVIGAELLMEAEYSWIEAPHRHAFVAPSQG